MTDNQIEALERIRQRILKLGLECPDRLDHSQLQPPTLALACMPMYYVAVVLEIQDDEEIPESIKDDIFGVHRLREMLATSEIVSDLQISPSDERQLRSMLINRRSVDAIIYDYAVESLKLFLDVADPKVATPLRNMIARTMMNVALASGKRWFGAGAKATPQQVAIIEQINDALQLDSSKIAERFLDPLDTEKDLA